MSINYAEIEQRLGQVGMVLVETRGNFWLVSKKGKFKRIRLQSRERSFALAEAWGLLEASSSTLPGSPLFESMEKKAPWLVIEGKLLITKASHFLVRPSEEHEQVAILASKQDLQYLIDGLKELRPKGDLRFLETEYEYPSLKRIRELAKALEKLQREAFPDSKVE
jgi:hypothetical protein